MSGGLHADYGPVCGSDRRSPGVLKSDPRLASISRPPHNDFQNRVIGTSAHLLPNNQSKNC